VGDRMDVEEGWAPRQAFGVHVVAGGQVATTHLDPSKQLELTTALDKVSTALPKVVWEQCDAAFTACLDVMPAGTRNNQSVVFCRDTVPRVLYVMIGLNSIEKDPKCFTDLQHLWAAELKLQFTQYFFDVLPNCMRMLVRIGRVCSVQELMHWPEGKDPDRLVKTGDWTAAVDMMLDDRQPVFVNEHQVEPNGIWKLVSDAFIAEDGLAVLDHILDTTILVDAIPTAELLDKEQVLHCRIAKIIKSLLRRQIVPAAKITDRLVERMHQVSRAMTGWLKARLALDPVDLTQMGQDKDSEILGVLGEVIGPEEAVGLALTMLAEPYVSSQRAAIRLVGQFRGRDSALGAAFAPLPMKFLSALRKKFSGEGDVLVQQLAIAKVTSKAILVDVFEELNRLMLQDFEKAEVSIFWGDLGFRCTQTSEQRTRDIGIGLVEQLDSDRMSSVAEALLPSAERTFNWLTGVVTAEGTELARNLEGANLLQAKELICMLMGLYQVFKTLKSNQMASIPALWFDTAIRCLRCLDKYSIREMGFELVREAIRLNVYSARVRVDDALGPRLHLVIGAKENMQRFLNSLFAPEFIDHALVRLVSSWLIESYYRDYCYEDERVDLMKFLVPACLHNGGAQVEMANLLIKLTVKNISIRSMNSLCNQFVDNLLDKATASSARQLVLRWLEETMQKKWVMGVQEHLLALLWNMMVHRPVPSDEKTHTVLSYFYNQYSNMKLKGDGDAVEWGGLHMVTDEGERADCTPDTLAALAPPSSLQDLMIGGCPTLSGALDPLVGHRLLQRLFVIGCPSLCCSLEPLRGLSSIRELVISLCDHLTGTLEPLAALSSLQQLVIRGGMEPQLTGTLEPLAGLSSLQRVELQRLGLSGTLQPLASLCALQDLSLSQCALLSGTLQPLAGLLQLQQLTLQELNEVEGGLEILAQLASLNKLTLANCGKVSGTVEPLSALTELQRLQISGCLLLSGVFDPLPSLHPRRGPAISENRRVVVMHRPPFLGARVRCQVSSFLDLPTRLACELFLARGFELLGTDCPRIVIPLQLLRGQGPPPLHEDMLSVTNGSINVPSVASYCHKLLLHQAAMVGSLDVAQWAWSRVPENCDERLIWLASEGGHSHLVRWLLVQAKAEDCGGGEA